MTCCIAALLKNAHACLHECMQCQGTMLTPFQKASFAFRDIKVGLTSDARGCEDATMPLLPRTGDLRPLKSMIWKGSLAVLGAIVEPASS